MTTNFLGPFTLTAGKVNDISPYAFPPPPALPPAGESFLDRVFGTRITRLTDPTDGPRCAHNYCNSSPLSKSSEHLLFCAFLDDAGNTRPMIADFDRTRSNRLKRAPSWRVPLTPSGKTVDWQMAWWSALREHSLICKESQYGSQILDFDADRRTFKSILDGARFAPAGCYLARFKVDLLERRFALAYCDQRGVYQRHVIWDRARDTILQSVTTMAVEPLDKTVSVDPSGNFFSVAYLRTTAQYPVQERTWDLRSMAVCRETRYNVWTSTFDHYLSHPGHGWGVKAGRSVGNGIIYRYDLDGSVAGQRVALYPRPLWFEAHGSLNQFPEQSFLAMSFAEDAVAQNKTGVPLSSEIAAFATDGSGEFTRLAHTQCLLPPTIPAGWRYWFMPRAAVALAGDRICWTSNWGAGTFPCRSDVFAVDIQ